MILEGTFDERNVCRPPIEICPTSATNTGGGTTPDPVKLISGIQKDITITSSNDVVLPSGAYYVSIRPMFYNKPININGETYYLGEEFNRQVMVDEANCIQDYVSGITIAANGNIYDITIVYPSSHTVNLATIGL